MSLYRIWICDPLNEVRSTGQLVPVARRIESWFAPIAQGAGFTGAQCVFPQYIVKPDPHELLIYVCPSMMSVVQNMPAASSVRFPNPRSSPHQGVTIVGPPAGSEIWMKVRTVDAITSLIFHEAMHNKLQLGDALHGRFPRCQLSCRSITWPTSPSGDEARAMTAVLRNNVPQWTEGQHILRRARLARKKGDPAWDVEIKEK